MKLHKFLEGFGFVFEPKRPLVKEKPYEFTDKNSKFYNKSWKETANARKDIELKNIDDYFNEKKKEARKFKKKAYKNLRGSNG